jgi:exodeoxyribonuclease VII small subunit
MSSVPLLFRSFSAPDHVLPSLTPMPEGARSFETALESRPHKIADCGGVMEPKVKDFESALKSLEEIVAQLESGDLTLDRALELFEEGVQISRFCSSKLEEAERKVEVLIKTADGVKEMPFSEDVESSEP